MKSRAGARKTDAAGAAEKGDREMLFSDYIEQVEQDAREYLEDNADYISHDPDNAIDELWTADSVTGNGSGSYTFNTAKAWKNVTGDDWSECLLFDEDFIGALEEMSETIGQLFEQGPEAVDVTARVLALYRVDWEAVYADVFGDEDEEPAS